MVFETRHGHGIAGQLGLDHLQPHVPLLHEAGAVPDVELQAVPLEALPVQREEKSGHIVGSHRRIEGPLLKVAQGFQVLEVEVRPWGPTMTASGRLKR